MDIRTLMEMLWRNEWYRDALYHDGYGEMIHSGDFSGTSAQAARRNVTGWLKENGVDVGL